MVLTLSFRTILWRMWAQVELGHRRYVPTLGYTSGRKLFRSSLITLPTNAQKDEWDPDLEQFVRQMASFNH